jgi:hypothetical protein
MNSAQYRIVSIEQLNAEWNILGRSPDAVRAFRILTRRDADFRRLVHGPRPGDPPAYETPYDLLEFMGKATGQKRREQAAGAIRVLLREAEAHPLISRMTLQALIPGMVTIARRLRWGQGASWEDGNEFFTELVSITWEVLSDWSGQDRPFAVIDLLSAARCRIRRQLFRERDLLRLHVPLTHGEAIKKTARSETELEQVTRLLIDLRDRGMRTEEVEIVYAQHVLGYSISELATVTGLDRRSLYTRRDRARRLLCA